MSDRSPMGSSLDGIQSISGRGETSRRGIPHASGDYEGEALLTKQRPRLFTKERKAAVGSLSAGDHFQTLDGMEGMVLLHGQFEARIYGAKPGTIPPAAVTNKPGVRKGPRGVFEPGTLVVFVEGVRAILSPTVEVALPWRAEE